jgi:hypothetical protein
VAATIVASFCTVAYAAYRTISHDIKRTGTEQRCNVVLNVPYGTFNLIPGTKAANLARVEIMTEDMEDDPPMHIRYWLDQLRTTGTLKVTLGSDEGMLDTEKPLVQAYRANTGFSLVSTNPVRTEWGAPAYDQADAMYLPISYNKSNSNNERSKLFLSTEVPLSLSAQLGFGESTLDLTGLQLTSAFVETGASSSYIVARKPNPIPMSSCTVNAGVGSFSMDGICFLNAGRYHFSGGVGYYRLNFNGKLQRNMDAIVEVGLGKVTLDIPADAARVQVFYDDGFFCSFTFQGLNKRREGYATSVGFDQSTAPILTLRLSSGMGKMEVRYR